MTVLFEVPFGESPGQFYFEPSPLGPELDTYPREFVRDPAGNFLFLEPAPAARLTKYSATGKFLWAFPLADHLPDSLGEGEVSPQEVFAARDGAAVMFSMETDGTPMRAYLANFDTAGSFKSLVVLRDFDPRYFDEGGVSQMDGAGYLLALRPGGTTEVYGPDGARRHVIDRLVSYVDPSGLLFTVSEPITILTREGAPGKELTFEGDEAPESIDGGNGKGLLWAVSRAEEKTEGNRLINPWSLKTFWFSAAGPSAGFVRRLDLPPSVFQSLGPDDPVTREQVYGPTIVMDDHGAAYVLGRSERKCWIVKIDPV